MTTAPDGWADESARAAVALLADPEELRRADPVILASPWRQVVTLAQREQAAGRPCDGRAVLDLDDADLPADRVWLAARMEEAPVADALGAQAACVLARDGRVEELARPARLALEDGAELLDELVAFLRRYVVVDERQAVAVVLWAAHAHAIEAAETTPYLAVTSAEKRSGKSRLVVELLPLLVPRPLAAANISVAALARSVAADPPPTLLLDEADATFGQRGRGGSSERAEDLRGILNAGYRRGATYTRMVGQGAAMTPESFPIFGAKALAGIGELPDTIADRSIALRMKRKAPGERVRRFRRREVEPEAAALLQRLAAWTEGRLDELAEARPALPDALDDRAADGWEPLLAIADAAGGAWPERSRRAALALSAGRDGAEDASLGVRLLADLRVVFDASGADRLSSASITAALNAMEESPWGGFKDGSGIGARALAKMLGEYGVVSGTVRLADGTTAKGYKRESLDDPWSRYAPPEAPGAVTPSQPVPEPESRPTAKRHTDGDVTDEDAPDPAWTKGCDGVTDRGASQGRPVAADDLLDSIREVFPFAVEEPLPDPASVVVEELAGGAGWSVAVERNVRRARRAGCPMSPADAPRLLTAEEVAEQLAMKPAWVLEQARRERVPHYRLGRMVRFAPEHIEHLLAATLRVPAKPADRRGDSPKAPREPAPRPASASLALAAPLPGRLHPADRRRGRGA